jgi:hypothetical protein
MYRKRISPVDRGSLPFDPEPGCLIDFGLHCVACDARFALQSTVEWKGSLALAQLILDVEKLRRVHSEQCSACKPGAAA